MEEGLSMPDIVTMIVAAILAVAVPVLTFVLVSGWMIAQGVPPVLASVVGAAAVFGEIFLVIKAAE